MPERPTCPCGHDRHHRAVQPVLRLGPWRWALAALVGSEVPAREVRFVCAACGAEVERAGDAETLRQYGRWPLVDRAALRRASALPQPPPAGEYGRDS